MKKHQRQVPGDYTESGDYNGQRDTGNGAASTEEQEESTIDEHPVDRDIEPVGSVEGQETPRSEEEIGGIMLVDSDRNEKGQFLPGNSGGPGRPKGAKNKGISAIDGGIDLLRGLTNAIRRKGTERYFASLLDKDPARLLNVLERLLRNAEQQTQEQPPQTINIVTHIPSPPQQGTPLLADDASSSDRGDTEDEVVDVPAQVRQRLDNGLNSPRSQLPPVVKKPPRVVVPPAEDDSLVASVNLFGGREGGWKEYTSLQDVGE